MCKEHRSWSTQRVLSVFFIFLVDNSDCLYISFPSSVYLFPCLCINVFSFLITRPKSSAKLLQNFELCKFFGKKIFQQFCKVVQNKNANRLFSAIYILEKHQKLSKIKSFQQSPVELFNKPQLSTLSYYSIFLQDTAFLGHMQGFSKISASYFT